RRTCFQPYHAAWKSAEETEHLAAAQPLAQNRRTLPIDAVNLKNMLGWIQSDRRNLAHGWLPVPGDSTEHQLGTSMPKGSHPPHHSMTSSASNCIDTGTSMPSALAVFMLITSSNFVGCTTGRSAGFSPLSIRPT